MLPPGPLSQRPEPLNMEFSAQMARDWNPESSLVETAKKTVGPALLNEPPRSSGGDGAATGGSWGTELDPVVPMLFPKDGPVGIKHRGVAPAKEERMEFRKEGGGGGEIKRHNRFLALAHCDGRPLVPGAAEEGRMVLLEEVVVVFPRKEAGFFSRKAREAGNAEAEEGKRERPNGRKPEAGSQFPGRDTGDGENWVFAIGGFAFYFLLFS